MKQRYPILQPQSIPGSGTGVYLYLLNNFRIPSKLPHEIWYNGQKEKLEDKHHPFKGFFPIGETFKISYGGSEMMNYTFTGEEKNPVFVKDLSEEAMFAFYQRIQEKVMKQQQCHWQKVLVLIYVKKNQFFILKKMLLKC